MAFGEEIRELISKPGFREFSNSIVVDLFYAEIEDDPFPTPQEAEVWFQLGKVRRAAFVPLLWVDKDRKTAKAALLGESGGEILVSFPPTNFGQTRFYARKEELEKIAANSLTE
ncbi:MAG: hypothetical protein OXI91_16430 [Chloroflexota bacterium]|nr:hypothetical protein [Chloroflexota bacterium]